jgi:hypothetical protein
VNIGYSCLGRSWNLSLDNASTLGGDIDRARLLFRLATAHPSHTFVLIGRNSGEDPSMLGYPSNVVNPYCSGGKPPKLQYPYHGSSPEAHHEYLEEWERVFDTWPVIDEHIMWVGQHGGSNSPMPQIGYDWADDKFTNPQMAFMNYCSYLLHWTNLTGVEPLALVPDPRNYWKARELREGFTRPLLGQFNEERVAKYDQYNKWDANGHPPCPTWLGPDRYIDGYREQSVWVAKVKTVYAGIEMTALDDPFSIPFNPKEARRLSFGVITNENRKEVTLDRKSLVRDWVIKNFPDAPIYGTWSKDSQAELGRTIAPVPASQMYSKLREFRSTVTLPASGSGWATAKPWEAFAVGTVCFFHHKYDSQGHILPLQGSRAFNDLTQEGQFVAAFLRVKTPDELGMKVNSVTADDELHHMLVTSQRRLFEKRFGETRGGAATIEDALMLGRR